ncbi:hypothetical protein B0I37DRAFT_157107 [Chaetomium sp. MPI-CAGE-AT-0009]|nr:hypothetical protein B0I37DRAFT_157107 [Chaetomium sp. MPI-CAGE-AT-0009]
MDVQDYYQRTALICAVRHGHKAIVELLLSKGADLKRGEEPMVELLLNKSADLETEDGFDRTALSMVPASRGKMIMEPEQPRNKGSGIYHVSPDAADVGGRGGAERS